MTDGGIAFPIKALGALFAVVLTLAPANAQRRAGTLTFSGVAKHVSENNIKVTDPKTEETRSFLIMPNFDQIFSFDGRAMHQIRAIMPGQYVMQAILPGQYVRIYYDQKLLGQRRADRILLFSQRSAPRRKP